METHGEILKRLAKQKGFTQEELAKKLEMNRSAVQQYMSKGKIPDNVIVEISKALNVPKSAFDLKGDKTDGTLIQDYERLQNLVNYQESLLKSMQHQLQRIEDELSEYKSQSNRQTG